MMMRDQVVERLVRLTDSLLLADRTVRMELERSLAAFLYQNMNTSRAFSLALTSSGSPALSLVGRLSINLGVIGYDWPPRLEEDLQELEGEFMKAGAFLLDDAVPDMLPDDWE